MIPYAEAINRRDMLAYWGTGYVLLQFGGKWSAYQLCAVSDDGEERCTLRATPDLRQPDAPNELVLSKERFFEQALLHRPPLGTVFDAHGNVLVMSWRAARGDKIKALVPEDVFFTELPFQINMPAEPEEELAMPSFENAMAIWAKAVEEHWLADRPPVHDIAAIYPMAEFVRAIAQGIRVQGHAEARPDTMKLVLDYLNRPRMSLYRAAEEATVVGAAVDKNDLLLMSIDEHTVSVFIGGTALGTMHKTSTGWLIEHAQDNENPVKQRALAGMFDSFIPEEGIL